MARKHVEREGKRDKRKVDPYAVAAVSPSYLRFQEAYGICGEDYVRPLNLTKYPFKMPIGWANGFIANKRLRSPVAIVCEPITGDALTTQINRTMNMATPQPGDGMLTFTERAAKQFQAENAAQINAMLLNENAKLFNAVVYPVLRADCAEDLKPRKEYLDDVVYKTNRARVEKQLSNTRAAFFAASPCLSDDPAGTNAYGVPMPAETIALGEFTQVYGFDDGEGIMLGTDNNGGSVRLDFHRHTVARPNGNIILVCEAGNGKSTLMKHITLDENLFYSTRVIVAADPDSEYSHMCVALGGEVTDPVGKLSPFEPRNIASADSADDDGGETAEYYSRALQERVLSNHIPFLKTFLQMAFPLIDDETAGVLGTPITAIYGQRGVTPDTTFAEYYAGPQAFPVLEDLYRELLDEAREEEGRDAARAGSLRRAALAIEDAAVGYDREMWNTRERFDPSSKFLVIDTSNLSADKNVKSAQLYNILMWVWSQVRSHRFDGESYTRIVMDELNSIVNKENRAATAQIADMVRRVRKYNAGVMFAFQVVNSLLDEEIRTEGQIILDNCVYKFFGSQTGKQAGGNLWQAQQYLALTDKVRDELGKAARGHFILSIGKKDKTWVHVDCIEPWEFEVFGRGGGSSGVGRIAKIAAAALMCLLLMFGTALPFSFSLLEKQQTSSQATFSGDGVEEICWNYLVGKGLSEQAAAGILGNMKQESIFDTSADNGTHYGLCQWGLGRLTGLKAYAEARGKDVDDVEVQLSYLWCEMTDEEDSGIECGYASNQWCNGYDLDDLKNASSPTEAAEIFGVAIERFGAGETGARHTYAEELYEAHKGQSASSSASSKTPSSSRSEYGWGCVGQQASKTSGSSELARRYVELAKSGEMFGCSAGMCEAWVEEVLRNVEGIDAGQVARMCCATGAWEAWGVSTSRDGIPLGANVYGYSNPSAGGGCHSDYGHVAIYIGDGQVISNEGGVATTRDLFGDGGSWDAVFGYRGWGWCGGIDLSSANGELVDIARSKIGLTYHYAAQGTCPSGTPPSGTSGEEYDCSGLVDEALSEAGWAGFGSKGSHGPDSTALLDYAKQNWEKVDEGDVSDGDIAFFINPAKDWTCTHVAICTSSGTVIEAAGDEYHDAKVQNSDIWTFPGGYNEYYRPSR